MSIDTVNDLPRRNQYVAAASQTVFDYTFPIFADADLVVYVDDVLQALNTDYTVAGATDDAGGTITFVTPLAGSEVVVIYSDLAIERTTDFQQNGPLASASFNDQLDRLTLICRELKDRIGRAIRWPVKAAQSSDDLELNLANYTNKYLYVNTDGELEPAAALATTTLTQSVIADLLNPQTTRELAVLVTPANRVYREGESPRYSTLADNVLVCKGLNQEMQIASGTHNISAALVVDAPINMRGKGIDLNVTAGTILNNTTNDVAAITATNATRSRIEDLGIIHQAATKYAIVVEDSQYAMLNNLKIDCNDIGFGGIFLGTTTVIPDSDNFLSVLSDLDIRDFTTRGVRVNSTGHTIELRNLKVGGGTAGGVALEINTEHVNVNGGQYGNNAAGGSKGIWFNNLGAGDIEGGYVGHLKMEGIQASQYGIDIDGTTNAFTQVLIEDVGANLTGIGGTVLRFGRAKWCKFVNPAIRNPTGGGTLCEWGANSIGCELVCNYEAATAPITVNASATRATKTVTGVIARSQVTNITTNANLRTVLIDGIDELPGHLPVHSYGAWNYWLVTLADDAASSFTLPAVSAALVRTRVKVLHDGAGNFMGTGRVDADSGGAAVVAESAGADFNVTTGALTGTTGTDVKVTLSAHTDGKIYLENRSGATRDFTVLLEPVIFGT